ncbi:PAAR domain-containing protein [Trinickia sp.]|uniref:PAAR domain-containing protein n=1 Tax=Trinickia sp. TaxID=2571163 RepID=UPI003F7DAF02
MPRIAEEKDVQPDSASEPKHLFATIGALSELGGRITKATGGLAVAGLTAARVSDVVTYEDGSEAAITDDAGEYAVDNDKPIALVGSRLSNGDIITDSPERDSMASSTVFIAVKRSTENG